MSMCYLCDLCAVAEKDMFGGFRCHVQCAEHGNIYGKRAIDYGRDDPKAICKHFEPKEGGDD